MTLEEAVKVSKVQRALGGTSDTPKFAERAIAWRKSKTGTLYAFSKNNVVIDTYSGPSDRVRDRLKKVYRRSTLYYKEVKDKLDWEPL